MFQTITSLDYFATIVGLRYKGSWRYKSFIGGLTSIFLFLFSSGIIIYFLIQFLSKVTINMNLQTTKNFDPPYLNLKSDFSVAISMQYGAQNLIRPEVIGVSFEYVTFDLLTNNLTIIPVDSVNCTYDMFKNAGDQYQSLGIENGICIDFKTKELSLQGSNINNYFSFIRAKLTMCSNKSYCLSQNEISNILSEVKPVANLYYLDSTFQPTNSTNFVVYFINNVNVNITYNNAKETDIFFSVNSLKVQNGLVIPTDPEEINKITIDGSRDLVSVRTPNQMNLLNFNLKSSKNSVIINLSYMPFSQFLANIGGIINNIMLLFTMIIYLINNVLYQRDIVRDLFRFRGGDSSEMKEKIRNKYIDIFNLTESKNKKKDILVLEQKANEYESKTNETVSNNRSLNLTENKMINLNYQKEIENQNNRNNINDKNVCVDYNNKLTTTIDVLKKENNGKFKNIPNKQNMMLVESSNYLRLKEIKKQSFSHNDIIFLYFCSCLSLFSKSINKKRVTFNKIEKYLNLTQDISCLYKKVIEIDFIKYLLFSNDQINVMKFLMKPEFVFSEETNKNQKHESPTDSFSKFYSNYKETENFTLDLSPDNKAESEKLISSFENILKGEANEMNIRLIKSFQNIL